MAERALVEKKLSESFKLASQLASSGAPLLAAYWELLEETGRWDLQLVPISPAEEMALITMATDLLVEPPYRFVFSVLDVAVNARQIDRARAVAAYMRSPEDIGRRFDTTFTGGEYFEAFIVVYLAPELQRHLSAA